MQSIKHKKDIAYELSIDHNISFEKSCNILDFILKKIEINILTHRKTNIVNFGSIKISKHKEKKGRNPKTGTSIILPERWAYYFKQSDNSLKKLDNKENANKKK